MPNVSLFAQQTAFTFKKKEEEEEEEKILLSFHDHCAICLKRLSFLEAAQ